MPACRALLLLLLAVALGGCARPPATTLPAFMVAAVEAGEGGRCFGRDTTPAVIETVSQQAPERASGGRAVWRNDRRQRILRERQAVRFEVLCPPAYTPALTEALQRALVTRGHHPGPVTGALDPATLAAVRSYQRLRGLDSALLSLEAARALGLVAVSPEELARMNAR
ncbi:peptidoglycan-binding domain-containing protein [Pseudoroseicyclus aestuarii]|uniref:Putative peptidoglycan binding protein n=1 Tax=Pseudoroseicyclus aestuarii TaxID=1795041 RepID=A0A318SUP3_9RHOB|nr:peptidoglycan-binding domain-containing protein [Pseudoroseicyclus aestuarii]PYE85630.1 putative peptidoglycan binding protein [Pseudoroseicyclus aestuarii]